MYNNIETGKRTIFLREEAIITPKIMHMVQPLLSANAIIDNHDPVNVYLLCIIILYNRDSILLWPYRVVNVN